MKIKLSSKKAIIIIGIGLIVVSIILAGINWLTGVILFSGGSVALVSLLGED